LPGLNGGGAAAAVPPGSKLHNSCIYSVASHSWCQITPLTPSCIMSSGILAPSPQTTDTPLATLNCCS